MKKFFKILRKIIKILLKSILWLILGIIVIVAIGLVIINNRTIKEYEDYDGNIKYTMNKDFIINKGYEFKINITDLEFSNKNLGNGYLEDESNIKLNLSNISMIKDLYTEGKFENFYDEILPYFIDFHVTLYYDNGLIESILEYIHGFKKGYGIYYFENGQISDEAVLNNGISESTGYYKNGIIKYIRSDNKFDNVYFETGYYENGIISYINNSDGYNVSYYEDGSIRDEGFSKNGKLNGIITGYYVDGKIFKIENHNENGDISCIYYDENGIILGSGGKINGQQIGLIIRTNDNGKIGFIGDLNGKGTGYYENGNIGFIGNYINGKLTGESIRFSTGGNIIEIGNNENLYRVNTYYDENGNILGSGCDEIISSCSDSLHIEYSQKDGKILEKGKYNGLDKDGYRVEYFEDGQTYSEGNYDNGKRVGTRNRYLGDGSIGVSKNYDE